MIIIVSAGKRQSQLSTSNWLCKLPFDALEWIVRRMVLAVEKRLVKSSRKTYEHKGLPAYRSRLSPIQTNRPKSAGSISTTIIRFDGRAARR